MAKLKPMVEIVINAPLERTWEIMSDLHGAADRISAITQLEVLTEGDIGVGTRWRETRIMMKKEATEEMWITAWDPPNGYSVGGDSCGSSWLSEFRLTPQGAGTRVEMLMSWKANTFLAKLMTPLGWLMSGMMKKCMRKDFEDIKAAAEAPAEAATS